MTDTDRPRFAAALVALAEVLGGDLSERAHVLYFEALKDIPWGALQVACRRALETCKFLPKPAELRELACGPAESPEDRAERAWLAWRTAARLVGSYRSLTFEDAALATTLVAMFGGWPEACVAEFSDEMWAAKRKEFARVYRVMQSRAAAGPVQLAGHHARENALAGQTWDPRRLKAAPVPLLTAGGDICQRSEAERLDVSRLPHGLKLVAARRSDGTDGDSRGEHEATS